MAKRPGLYANINRRKRLGISVMLFLLLLTALSYFAMKQIWAPIKK